jgi:hypothetical protein
MSLKFTAGDLTIHGLIEEETTFLPVHDLFAGLTPDLLAENRRWLRDSVAIDATDMLILCFQSYVVSDRTLGGLQEPRICLRTAVRLRRPFGNRTTASTAFGARRMPEAAQRPLPAESRGVSPIGCVMPR